jgi:alpha-galactosidase
VVAPKVVVVGAGSASFGPSVVAGLLGHAALVDMRLHLHDVDAVAVERMGRFATLLAAARGRDPRRVSWGNDPGAALDGADAVVLSVAIDREATWARDRAIALAQGIDHYAENGGPAAIFHAARNLGLILPIAREMERRCPDAWLVNYTNPVARVATALRRYTRIRSVGVCHQLNFGYFMVGTLLAADLGIELPPAPRFRWTDEAIALEHRVGREAAEKVHIRAAGLNHLTWILSLTDRATGADLYPLLWERNGTFDRGFEPLNRRVGELFGVFPVPGDCHLCEYLPYTHEVARGTWQRYDIQMYDLDWSERRRQATRARVERIVASGDAGASLAWASERAEDVVAALCLGTSHYDEALNLPNAGAISNLPADAIVETPVRFGPDGPQAEPCGALPAAVAELCRRQITITELAVQGAVEGDRDALRAALALDPMVTDPDLPETLLDAYLAASERYLAPLRV